MTTEEAIKMLEYIKHVGNGESEYKNDAQAIAIDMAIKALEKEPCITMRDLSDKELKHFAEEMKKVRPQVIEQEPCDDCISREAAIDAIYKKHIGGKDAIKNASINDLYADGLAEAVDAVWELPSVTSQPKMGRWIRCDILQEYKCSECRVCFRNKSKYCPNCGAKMEIETKIEQGLNFADQDTMMSAT